jgi:hypothetical protein
MKLRDSSAPAARPVYDQNAWAWLRRALAIWERPLPSILLALAVYAVFARVHGDIGGTSPYPYYNYLADALLHDQLSLRLLPPVTHDLSVFQGRYYMYWPPMPAILLLPFVALFGVQFSDILFTIALGALNVGLVALLLRYAARYRVVRLSRVQRALLVLFFAFGTVHLTLAPHGRIWFTGQLVGFMFVALAYLAAIGLRGWPAFTLTGVALACALLTRNHLVLAGLWPACYLLYRHRSAGWPRLLGYLLAAAAPVALGVALYGAYNWMRFGSAFDNGLAYHRMDQIFVENYRRYGPFSLHYLPANLFYQYLAYPFPIRAATWQGGSLFLLSPVFLAACWGLNAGRARWSGWVLLATILLVNVPILLLMGTGWVQFGPRYTLDFTVPLLLLTALGLRRWPAWLLALLAAVSIASYLVGTLYFGQHLTLLGG